MKEENNNKYSPKGSGEIIQEIKSRYIEDFGKLDDRAYFVCGFVETVLNDLDNRVGKGFPERSEFDSMEECRKQFNDFGCDVQPLRNSCDDYTPKGVKILCNSTIQEGQVDAKIFIYSEDFSWNMIILPDGLVADVIHPRGNEVINIRCRQIPDKDIVLEKGKELIVLD